MCAISLLQQLFNAAIIVQNSYRQYVSMRAKLCSSKTIKIGNGSHLAHRLCFANLCSRPVASQKCVHTHVLVVRRVPLDCLLGNTSRTHSHHTMAPHILLHHTILITCYYDLTFLASFYLSESLRV